MTLFQNKYRNESIRLPHWDYANDGAYFITICTKNREHYFGEIKNGSMELSPLGAVANVLWYEIKNHAKNITLGEFVVMPNHIHGVLILSGNDEFVGNHIVGALHATPLQYGNSINPNNPKNPNDSNHSSNLNDINNQPTRILVNQQMSNLSPKSNSISTIIRSYKSAVTNHANRLNYKFEWQSRFHDHLIRDEKSFDRISNYIINNPTHWKEDKFFNQED